METASILGVRFDAVTMQQAVDTAMDRLRARRKGYVVTPNPEIVDLCRKDSAYMDIVNRAALVLPDGIGIIYAAKILGEPVSGKVAGVEFAEHLVSAMAKEHMRLFLLGAKPGVAEQAGKNLCAKYPGLVLAGSHDGYFSDPQTAVDAVNACGGADVVFVCLGAPKQEKFMAQYQDALDATLLCGLGGSLTYLPAWPSARRIYLHQAGAGVVLPPPQAAQPHRAHDDAAKFLLIVIGQRLSGRKGK